MHIDDLFDQITKRQDYRNIVVANSWSQGRTVFGGLSAALIFLAAKANVPVEKVIRSINVNFVGPLLAETGFDIEVDVIREGKNSAMVLAKAIQNGQVCVLMQACFASARSSSIEVPNQTELSLAAPTEDKIAPFMKGIAPEFVQHMHLCVQEGQFPFTASKSSTLAGWMRFAQQSSVLTDAHLIALIDAWPPATLQMADVPSPASSMTWNVEFIHPHASKLTNEWLAYKCITRQAGAGYAHTEADIWNEQGDLIAVSRQCVTVFA